MFTLHKNIKVAIPHEPGRLVFEFKRPTTKEKNIYTAAKIDLKTEGADRLNSLAEMRLSLYNAHIAAVYGEKDGTRFDVFGEDGQKVAPADFPDDMKIDAVIMAFDGVNAQPVNF